MPETRISIKSHKGPREAMEDTSQVLIVRGAMPGDEAAGLIVADGANGPGNGDVASKSASAHLSARFGHALVEAVTSTDEWSDLQWQSVLTEAVESTNEAVLNLIQRAPGVSGMATTMVCGVVHAGRFHFAWAGDSRAYQYCKGVLRQLTRDDRQIQPLIDAGLLTPEQAEYHPLGHVITRYVGMPEGFSVSTGSIELTHGDIVLLCTDGLTGAVPDSYIAQILRGCQDGLFAFEDLADQLVMTALEARTTDNVTAVCCQYRSNSTRDVNTGQTLVDEYPAALAQSLYR